MTRITYPSGTYVDYVWTKDKVTGINVNSAPLLSGATYQPFGAAKGWSWSDGTAYSRSFDLSGRMAGYPLSGPRSRTLGYDADGRIAGFADADSGKSQSFSYDAASRLKSFVEGANARGESYAYDAGFNRKSLTPLTGAATAYTYTGSSNRLLTAGARTITTDASGNITNDGYSAYTYDGRNRLVKAVNAGAGTVTYLIDGQGRRVSKTSYGYAVAFAYDQAGHMLGKYAVAPGGTISRAYETIYLGDTPVGVVTGSNAAPATYRVFPDHLDAPRALVDNATGITVWRWDGSPFGAELANDDADGNGQKVGFFLRYPGQYFDAETNTSQNGFRDYSPALGRYLQSDPIGLAGGINTYGYVGQNPGMGVDPLGLARQQDLGKGYMGRLDQFSGLGGQAGFEIHVYKGDMAPENEVGVYGPNGWINKHGLGAADVPGCVSDKLQTWSNEWMQKAGLAPGGKILRSFGGLLNILDFLVLMQRAREMETDPFTLFLQDYGVYGPNST